ncbi:MAG TPA: hypothetical protein V6D17_19635 [Candidatus Obscuribacterales bacterium]
MTFHSRPPAYSRLCARMFLHLLVLLSLSNEPATADDHGSDTPSLPHGEMKQMLSDFGSRTRARDDYASSSQARDDASSTQARDGVSSGDFGRHPIATAKKVETLPLPYKYVGNVESLKFHRPSCPFARCMSVRRMILFHFRKEAIAQEQKPCRYCLPPDWKSVSAVILGPYRKKSEGSAPANSVIGPNNGVEVPID